MRTLERISISGFKSIREQALPLESLNLLIGPNGAGKSNFVEAIRFVGEVVNQRLARYVLVKGGADKLLHRGRRHTPCAHLQLDFAGDEERPAASYQLKVSGTENNGLFIQEEAIRTQAQDGHSGTSDAWTRRDLQETGLQERPVSSKAAEGLFQDLNSCQAYDFRDASPSATMRHTCDLHDNRSLRPQAENLAAYLYWLQETEPVTYALIEGQVRQIAPFFDAFDLEPMRLTPDCIQLAWTERETGARFRAPSMSEGTLRFICLATLLLSPDMPKVVVLDEPEFGLHPDAIEKVAALLRIAARKTQLIVATQSVTLVNHFEPASVWLVDRRNGASLFRSLKDQDYRAWLEDYALGELWEKNVLEALYGLAGSGSG